jgi:hypothetical protein
MERFFLLAVLCGACRGPSNGPPQSTEDPRAPSVAVAAPLESAPASNSGESPGESQALERVCLPKDSGAFYTPTADPLHPRVRYVDGQESLNDSCIVLAGNKLNRRVPPAYVNGRPLGFC